MKPAMQEWDEQWSTPSTQLERLAPLLAFALAIAVAWF